MMTFWLLALVLLVSALLLLLWPVLRVRKHQAEEDRTALNVALYQERLAELQGQREQGTLSEALFEQGRLEAERELLDDTAAGAPQQRASLGMALPLIASLLVPVAGASLYMLWGSSDQVGATLARLPLLQEQQAVDELMRRIPDMQPQEREAATTELIGRLENIVKMEPNAADVWFFLGRHYLMNEQRYADAAQAFSRAMDSAGRHPELLAQWAQAQFFANDKQWSPALQAAVDEVLADNPMDVATLGLIGIAGFETGHYEVARDAWSRLLSGMDSADAAGLSVRTGIERAQAALLERGEQAPAAVGPVLPALPVASESARAAASGSGRVRVRVELDPALRNDLSGDEAVFVFARPAQGAAIPLAARRLTVAELPVHVELSDADAMMDDRLLSTSGQVLIQASIARDGNAGAPDWVSGVQQVEVETGEEFVLRIDQQRPAAE